MDLLFIGYLIGLATAGLGLFIEEVLDKRKERKEIARLIRISKRKRAYPTAK